MQIGRVKFLFITSPVRVIRSYIRLAHNLIWRLSLNVRNFDNHGIEVMGSFFIVDSEECSMLVNEKGTLNVKLNHTAENVWKKINGIRSISTITHIFQSNFVASEQILLDVRQTVKVFALLGVVRFIPPSNVKGRVYSKIWVG